LAGFTPGFDPVVASAAGMVKQRQLALSDATEWLGDWHPLAAQLGSTDGLVELASVSSFLRLDPVHDAAALSGFLESYQERILFPLELPAIHTAYNHTARHELRELIALDQELTQQPVLQQFAGASWRVGHAQLKNLRPLRDERMVRRYLQAVESRAAHGWHTLVYGLTLEIYSLPLRQGLLGYAQQMTRGFIYSAARGLKLSERQCRELFDALCAPLPQAVEDLLRQAAPA
jgi:urease accessory protein UreF